MSTSKFRLIGGTVGNRPIQAFLKTMRPQQWTKNLIVYAGLVFDGQLLNPMLFGKISVVVLAFCFISSFVYVLNDIVDIDKDRIHPQKQLRPLPNGEIKPIPAAIGAIVLLMFGVSLGWWIDPLVAALMTIYIAINIAYSFHLKHVVIVDVMVLSTGFLLRVYAGVVVVDIHTFSPWLLICVTLLALFLGFGKRRHELTLLGADATSHRTTLAEYNKQLLDQIIGLVTTSTFIAYTLYTFEAKTVAFSDARMMLTIPFVFYFIVRYLYLIHVKNAGGAPDELLLRDRPLLINSVCWGTLTIILLYLVR